MLVWQRGNTCSVSNVLAVCEQHGELGLGRVRYADTSLLLEVWHSQVKKKKQQLA